MNKIDIGKLYVGTLYFDNSHYIDNKEMLLNNEIYNKTIWNGAIPLKDEMLINQRVYKTLFTLCYKIDDGKYLCLHNGHLYSKYSHIFLGNVNEFEKILPKIDYYYPSIMTSRKALSLFDRALNNKGFLYYLSKRNIQDFYTGTIKICDEIIQLEKKYPYRKEKYNVNVEECIPLENLYLMDGKAQTVDNKLLHFKIYKSLFYLFQDGSIYNLNNHFIYPKEQSDTLNHVISLKHSLTDALMNHNLYFEDLSINKALKIQKKVLKNVDFL